MKNKKIYIMVLTAIFSALTCVATFVHIPMPSGGIVHLGNFVMVIAALLCGGFVGGISGSLGMGLFDIYAGYGLSSILRSFILKFIIGFMVGYLFRLIIKKNVKTTPLLFIISGLSGVLLLVSVIFAIAQRNSFVDGYLVLNYPNKTLTLSYSLVIVSTIFIGVLFLLTLISSIISLRLKGEDAKYVKVTLFTVTISMFVHIILETILRTVLCTWIDGLSFETSFVQAMFKIPASIFTVCLTIWISTAIYLPLYKATKQINLIDDLKSIS